MKNIVAKHLFSINLALTLMLTACNSTPEHNKMLDRVDSIIEAHPDSALAIIQSIDPLTLRSDADKARYSVLHAMALDKNYIDTTDLSVIRPAIDYYRANGTPDQKLRSYYYQRELGITIVETAISQSSVVHRAIR